MRLINENFHYVKFISRGSEHVERRKMENAPAIKTNEANLEELNKKILEIKRKIVLKGEPLIISTLSLFIRRQFVGGEESEGKVQNLMTCSSDTLFVIFLIILSPCLVFYRGSEEGKY